MPTGSTSSTSAIGRNHSGVNSGTTPVNEGGATPTIEYWRPRSVSNWPAMAASPPVVKTSTSVSGEVTGSGRNNSESTSGNIAELTPTPSPSERIAPAGKPGPRRIQRRA